MPDKMIVPNLPVPAVAAAAPARMRTAELGTQGAPAVTDGSWDLLLICVAAHVLAAVGRIHQLFPVLLPLKPTLVTGAAAVVLYLLQQTGARRFSALAAPMTKYLFLLVLWVALSVPGALYPRLAFDLLTDKFLKNVVLFVLIVGSVRGFRDVERLAFAYFGAAAVYATVVLARFSVGGGSWRLGGLYYYDANDYATFAISALPLGLYFALGQRRWSKRLIGAAGLLPLLITIVWSGSRGGFLALLAVAAFVLFRFTTLSKTWRALGTAAVVITVLTTATADYWTQMRTILTPDQDYNRTSDEGRWKIWRRGIGYMFRHPVLGVGAANFPVAEGTISPLAGRSQMGLGVKWGAAHNSFVQVGAELGVPGLLLLVSFLGGAFVSLSQISRHLRSAPQTRGPPQLAQALMASLVGWAVGGFFLSLAYSEMLYTLVGLATALRKVSPPAERVSASRLQPSTRGGHRPWA